jgi:biopolymer transport protein ExbD
MADIAFLLLVFFLVNATIEVERGIPFRLPAYANVPNVPDVPDRNVLNVKLNFANQLLVEGKTLDTTLLKSTAKEFILNPAGNPELSVSPRQAVVSLQNDRSTTYAAYINVYNELKAAYNELWEESARKQFGNSYEKLSRNKQQRIRAEIPLVIS